LRACLDARKSRAEVFSARPASICGTGAALIDSQLQQPASAQSVDLRSKRRVRYDADSAEVRNVYRVNSYPTR
jgi:hypothetical protein